jgi:hypothetical protein
VIMTVNELIARLQSLAEQGYGESSVHLYLEGKKDVSAVICYPAKVTETGLSGWDGTIPPYILLREPDKSNKWLEYGLTIPKPLPRSFE